MFSQGSFKTHPKTESLCIQRRTDEQSLELMGDGHRNVTRIPAQEFGWEKNPACPSFPQLVFNISVFSVLLLITDV